MVPSSIPTQPAPSTNGVANSQALVTNGATGQTNFDQFIMDKTSDMVAPSEVISNPFKDIFQLLSFFWNPSSNTNFQSASPEKGPDSPIKPPVNSAPIKKESTQIEPNKPKESLGLFSDLQMLLTIIQGFLAGLENETQNSQVAGFKEVTPLEKETGAITGQSINPLYANNEIEGQAVTKPSQPQKEENDSKPIQKTANSNQEHLVPEASLSSESKGTQKVAMERETGLERNVKNSNIEKTGPPTKNSHGISEKPDGENKNILKINNSPGNNNSSILKDFHLKDFDIKMASFEYHGDILGNSLKGQNLPDSKEVVPFYISSNDKITTSPFFDLTGQKAIFSAITQNGQELNGEVLEITGTLNTGIDQSKQVKNGKFHLREVHLSAFENTLNTQKTQQKGPQDVLIVDFKNLSTNKEAIDKNSNANQQHGLNDLGSDDNNIMANHLNQTTPKIETSSSQANLQEKNVIFQITQGMSEALKLNKNRAVLHLNPPDLGTVRVNITVDHNNHVHANFIADHPDTKHLLEANLQHLKEHLAQNGFNLSNVNVDIGNGFSNPNSTMMGFMASNGGQQNPADFNTGEHVPGTNDSIENNPEIINQDDGIHIIV